MVAAVWQIGGDRVVAVSLDGTNTFAPSELTGPLPGQVLGLRPTPDGAHVLLGLSTQATAVPHLDAVLAADTDPASPKGARPIAPVGFVAPALGELDGVGGPGVIWPLFSTDGAHALMVGPKGALHLVPVDGSAAANPPAPLAAGPVAPLGDAPVGPDGVLLATAEKDVVAIPLAVGAAARALGTFETAPADGRWTPDGAAVVVRVGPVSPASPARAADGVFRLSAAGGETPVRLTPSGWAVTRMADFTPDGTAVIVESPEGGDTSLYRVPLDPGDPAGVTPLSPVDDARETFLGPAAGEQ